MAALSPSMTRPTTRGDEMHAPLRVLLRTPALRGPWVRRLVAPARSAQRQPAAVGGLLKAGARSRSQPELRLFWPPFRPTRGRGVDGVVRPRMLGIAPAHLLSDVEVR